MKNKYLKNPRIWFFLIMVCFMSEYQEAHTVSGLKGSPPGYVGSGEGGALVEPADHRLRSREDPRVYRSLSGALVEPEQVFQLNLDNSNLTSLPAEIGQLKNLTTLYLGYNKLSDKAKKEVKQLLPGCKISF